MWFDLVMGDVIMSWLFDVKEVLYFMEELDLMLVFDVKLKDLLFF